MATVILQARTGSTRLPGKAVKPILGKPMLWYTIETLKKSEAVDRIIMAIPENPADDILVEMAGQCGIDVFRGSESNVLERSYLAARQFPDDYYFRATGDNPIIDSENPDRSLAYLIAGGFDYVVERGMPLGTVVEAFSFDSIERAYKEGSSPEDIEHVTWYIKKSGKFNIKIFDCPLQYHFPELRLTVDYFEDFQRVQRIIENLYQSGIPSFDKVIEFLR